MYDIIKLNAMKVGELKELAEQMEISNADKLKKQDLIYKILDEQAVQNQGDAPEPEAAPTDSAPAAEATQPPAAEDRPKKERTRKPLVERAENKQPSQQTPPPAAPPAIAGVPVRSAAHSPGHTAPLARGRLLPRRRGGHWVCHVVPRRGAGAWRTGR